MKKLFETWFYAISIDFWVWYKWTKWLSKYVTDYCVYKRLTTDLMDVIVISLCVNGPKIKETGKVANISDFSQCCSRYTKNGKNGKTYNWNNDSGKYSDSFSTTSDSGYSNTTSPGAIIDLLSYAWSATCNAKPLRYVSIQHPQQTILDKLNRLETRLNTLDFIEDHLSTLSKKVNAVDTRCASLDWDIQAISWDRNE